MIKRGLLLSAIISLSFAGMAFSQENDSIHAINFNQPQTQSGVVSVDLNAKSTSETTVTLNQKDGMELFSSAIDKFVQSNVKSSYDDFQSLIKIAKSDFVLIGIAQEMADFGFFTLSNQALSKTTDPAISKLHSDEIKRFYFPKTKMKPSTEMSFGEIYSNIIYNDQAKEATKELLGNKTLLNSSDYANYLVALGSFKANNLQQARQYIDIAILQNPINLNYKKLKAEILSESKRSDEAIHQAEYIKKQSIYTTSLDKEAKSLEQYVLYKTSNISWAKNYHLGYYYFYENDYSKSAKSLQTAVSDKKCNKSLTYSLLANVYLKLQEYEKATEFSTKCYKISPNNAMNLITLGDLSLRKGNLKNALNYYKKASKYEKGSTIGAVKLAETYTKLNNSAKAIEVYEKILKTDSKNAEAYYNTALLEPEKKVTYLKKAVALNLQYKDAWVELAISEYSKGNIEVAQDYLNNCYYLDENDYRYYYYQGLIYKKTGKDADATYYFKKCLKLNPNFEPAAKELAL